MKKLKVSIWVLIMGMLFTNMPTGFAALGGSFGGLLSYVNFNDVSYLAGINGILRPAALPSSGTTLTTGVSSARVTGAFGKGSTDASLRFYTDNTVASPEISANLLSDSIATSRTISAGEKVVIYTKLATTSLSASSVDSSKGILVKYNNAFAPKAYAINLGSDGYIYFHGTRTSEYSLNTWYDLAIVITGGSNLIDGYVNGVKVLNQVSYGYATPIGSLTMARYSLKPATSTATDLYMDDCGIYKVFSETDFSGTLLPNTKPIGFESQANAANDNFDSDAATGVGGKQANDQSLKIAAAAGADSRLIYFDETSLTAASSVYASKITVEFNIYAKDINTHRYLQIKTNDTAWTNQIGVRLLSTGIVKNVEQTQDIASSYPLNKWVKVALVAHLGTKNYDVWVDGVRYQRTAPSNITSLTLVRLGFSSSTLESETYIDDFKIYAGEYIPSSETVTTITSTAYKIDSINSTVKKIPTDTTKQQLISNITTFAGANVKLFSNGIEITDNNQVVAMGMVLQVSYNGIVNNYELSNELHVTPLVFYKDSNPIQELQTGNITASFTITNSKAQTASTNTYLAVYEGNVLTSVIPQPVSTDYLEEDDVSLSVNLTAITANTKIKVFVWESSSQRPITEAYELK